MAAAASWLERDAPHYRAAGERFFLWVDEFDPHEPFDTPEPWTFRYHDQRDAQLLIWPPYSADAVGKGVLTPAQAAQVRANYGAKLSMIDHWLGRVLDAIDRHALWDDTAVVLLTDHGHYLGERGGAFGKPGLPIYNVMGHIPMLVAWPGVAPGDRAALTTTVDVHATLCDVFGVQAAHRTHGVSLRPVIEGHADEVRDFVLQGYFGREVNVVDRDGKYVRGPVDGPAPLSMWSNRWSTMPVHTFPNLGLPKPDDRAWLDRMPGSTVPVIRQPLTAADVAANPMVTFLASGRRGNQLFDRSDEDEVDDLAGSTREAHYVELLRHALDAVEAPAEHVERLGLG